MLKAVAESRDMSSVVLAGLRDTAQAAAAARTPGVENRPAPACTYAAAAVVFTSAGEAQITVANVGDSRAYWLPEPPAPPQRLTVDDSLAQGLISAGVPPDAHVVQKGAHTLTKWLGGNTKSKPWDDSSVSTMTTADRGVCCCARTACTTTCPRPLTSRRSATEPTPPPRRAHWSTTLCGPAATTTSPSS